MSKRHRLVFSGSGGQGVITAAIILAEAAVLHEKLNAVQTQVYGAAARGGATRSDVIISDEKINFPKVNQPNILVCLTQEAYDKFATIIRPGGTLITDPRFVTTRRKVDAVQYELPMYESVMEKIEQPIVFNTCMLGAVVGLTGVVGLGAVEQVLAQRLPNALMALNREALQLGHDLCGFYRQETRKVAYGQI
jgi:2-oxoglutarate ferredoxin oxidoreductase subunit gamma